MSAGSLDLGTLHLKMRADKDALRRDLKDSEREVEQSRGRMKRSLLETALDWARQLGAFFRRSGADAADGFMRDASGRLRDHRGRFVAEGKKIGSILGEAVSDGARTLMGVLGKLGSVAGSAGGGIGTLALVVGLLSAAMVFAIPLVYALGGAIAALPALTTGGIAAIATLLIGFSGLGEAFKKTSGAGGAVVDRARQIALAERRLTDAQREQLDAQLALNRAREEAAERLEDLDRSLRGARFDEADAAKDFAAAEKELARAERSGNAKRIDAARDAYARAQLQLEIVQDRVKDLELEQTRAAEAGVEGSDQVQAALRRQERATREVEDATYDMGRAGKSAGGAAAQEQTKLARSALATVAAIKSLKGEWENFRLEVQERLFAGVDVEIPALWAAWESTLHTRIGSMASMFNRLFKSWAETSKDPEFVKNIATGWESVEQLIGRVGTSIATKGLSAFGILSAKASPFLDMLGEKLGGAVDRFGDWIEQAEKSGALERFFDKATDFFSKVWDLGGDVVALLGEFFSMWTDSTNGEQAVSTFDAIRLGLADLREWLQDPENREDLKSFIDGFVLLGTVTMAVIGWLVSTGIPALWGAIETVDRVINGTIDNVGRAVDWVKDKWNGLWDAVGSGAKGAFNAVIGWWNKSMGAISITVPSWVPEFGGKSFGFGKIPMLADGGLVKAVPGGRPVIVGEGGEDEIVSPEAQMRRIVAEELSRVLAGDVDGGHSGVHIDQLILKAYSDRFSLKQVQQELAMHGAR